MTMRTMQPYVIALYTAKGIPMLWHGQEFAENWGVPGGGLGRNLFERPLHWSSFTTRSARHNCASTAFWARCDERVAHSAVAGSYYCYDQAHLQRGVIAYRRKAELAGASAAEDLLVLLNFSESETEVWLPFPTAGTWVERIDGTRPRFM